MVNNGVTADTNINVCKPSPPLYTSPPTCLASLLRFVLQTRTCTGLDVREGPAEPVLP